MLEGMDGLDVGCGEVYCPRCISFSFIAHMLVGSRLLAEIVQPPIDDQQGDFCVCDS